MLVDLQRRAPQRIGMSMTVSQIAGKRASKSPKDRTPVATLGGEARVVVPGDSLVPQSGRHAHRQHAASCLAKKRCDRFRNRIADLEGVVDEAAAVDASPCAR
jgi:hypothetical protein